MIKPKLPIYYRQKAYLAPLMYQRKEETEILLSRVTCLGHQSQEGGVSVSKYLKGFPLPTASRSLSLPSSACFRFPAFLLILVLELDFLYR